MNLIPLVLLLSTTLALPQDEPRPKKGWIKAPLQLGTTNSKAQRIPGGTEHEFHGVRLDLPATWKLVRGDEIWDLVPPGANPEGKLEEKHMLVHDTELTKLDGQDFEDTVQELADSVQGGLVRDGAPKKVTLGDLDGRTVAFDGSTSDGKKVSVRVAAFMAGKHVGAIASIGYADKIAARQADLQAIVGSLRAGARGTEKTEKTEKTNEAQPGHTEARPNPAEVQPTGAEPAERIEPAAPVEPAAPKASLRKRIRGAEAKTYEGVGFDLPGTWTVHPSPEATALVPTGANASGVLEEAYLFVKDPQLNKLDGPEVDASVAEAVQGIHPGAVRKGAVQKVRLGDVDARLYQFTGRDPQGRALAVKVYGFLGKSCACAMVVLGYSDVLGKRSKELQAILDSMAPPAAGNDAAKRGTGAGVRTELVGQWAYMANVNANTGGSMTQTILTLRADGSYEYKAASSSSNPFGSVAGESHHAGSWTASEDGLRLVSGDGKVRAYSLEKRNHPKNRQDPMIVLDGRAFVTATQRLPW